MPDEVEALVTLGDLEAAKALTEWLEQRGSELERPLARATAARCRGLVAAALGDGSGAQLLLEHALAEHGLVPQPFERARSLLVLGRIQRRMKKKAAARETRANPPLLVQRGRLIPPPPARAGSHCSQRLRMRRRRGTPDASVWPESLRILARRQESCFLEFS